MRAGHVQARGIRAASAVAAMSLAAVASVVMLRFPFAAALLAVGGSVVIVAALAPAATLLVYAASLVLFQVPLLESQRFALPSGTGALLLIVTAVHIVTRGRLVRLHSALPVFLAVMLATVVLSASVNSSFFLSDPRLLLTYFLLAATTMAAGQLLESAASVRRLVLVLSAAAAIVCVLTLYESWTGLYNPLGLFPSESVDRAYGVADPNYTAALIVTLVPFLAASITFAKRPGAKLLGVLLIGLSCLTVATTVSRGGAMGLAVALLATAWWVPAASPGAPSDRAHASSSVLPRVRLFALLAVLVAAVGVVAPTVLWERFSDWDRWSDPKRESRLRIWQTYVESWKESPWVGWGPGYVEQRAEEPYVAHNTPLQVACELGSIGFLAFLSLNVCAVIEGMGARRRFLRSGEPRLAAASGAVAASLVGFHSCAFFLTAATHKELWLLLGMAAALAHLARVRESRLAEGEIS